MLKQVNVIEYTATLDRFDITAEESLSVALGIEISPCNQES